MFTMPFHRDYLVTSVSDASTLDLKKRMTEIMHHRRDPIAQHQLGGSVGNLTAKSISPNQSGETTPKLFNYKPHSSESSHEGSPYTTNTHNKSNIGTSFRSPPTTRTNSLRNLNFQVKKSSSQTSIAHLSEISASNSQFFEVMYVGKIKVSHKKVPPTFIDEALPKFKAYDAQRLQKLLEAKMRRGSGSSDSGSTENISNQSNNNEVPLKVVEESPEQATSQTNETENDEDTIEFKDKILNTKLSEKNINPNKFLLRGTSHQLLPIKKDSERVLVVPNKIPIIRTPADTADGDFTPQQRDRSASIGSVPVYEQNRTMVLLIGKSDLRLISPDKKQILLHKELKELSTCIQGQKNADHFGIICREEKTDGYIGYVFKCQSDDVTTDIVATIAQSLVIHTAEKKKEKLSHYSCEHCPMLWYQKLCYDIEGLGDKKIHSTIFKRIDMLSEEEQTIIMAKYYGAEEISDHNLPEKNKFLMLMLRAHCESRQQRHIHDTAENRSEFLNQYLGGSTIFMKAKRSFDHILKRRGSKDDFGHMGLVNEPQPSDKNYKRSNSESSRRSSSFSLSSKDDNESDPQTKSHMRDIFMKVGNSPKVVSENHVGSWRQEILHRVVSGNDLENLRSSVKAVPEKRTKEELRDLWKTAIRQIIILSRMEKENARLQEQHNENEIKKIKLNYDEIKICEKQSADMWDIIIDQKSRQTTRRDQKVLLQAIKNGVPRNKRGEVWMYLAEQNSLNTAPIDDTNFPNYNTPYSTLLKCLTEHQHAIFIDLGRTFPNHIYYKQSLGIGQLSLFNLLKAYSILDPELGYCQGLGFICGVLLLHLDESDAFQMLKHLMFRRQMRLKYLPNMKNFQLQLYQMSRLLKDLIPELYEWFDKHDISPTLYAAPWILTVFSSQFPLGFVTRVFDLLFLESPEVIFKVAIALLEYHKDEIIQFDNFEDIMEYLKEVVPQINPNNLEKILKNTFAMDISHKIIEYQVEYNVLQEELTQQNHHLENLNKVKNENLNLLTQLQIATSSIDEMEKSRHVHQKEIQVMQTQIKGLEVTIDVLGQFILDLVDDHSDIEIPGEVRRILQQLNQIEQKIKPTKIIDRKLGKSKSLNSNLGYPLRVLEELNESLEKEPQSPIHSEIVKYNTYQHHKQYKSISFSTPLEMKQEETRHNSFHTTESKEIVKPIPSCFENVIVSPNEEEYKSPDVHPLSNCGDVNFRFHGTTQLKSLRPIHSRNGSSPLRNLETDLERNGRS